MITVAYIGLGSNLGPREERIQNAVGELGRFAQVLQHSQLRETKPVGNVNQPDFMNSVVEIQTEHSAHDVFLELKRIERFIGRTPTEKWGPREIDLDLLAFGDSVINLPDLEVPHPRMHERRFVLEPLQELNSTWIHPKLDRSVKDLLAKISDG